MKKAGKITSFFTNIPKPTSSKEHTSASKDHNRPSTSKYGKSASGIGVKSKQSYQLHIQTMNQDKKD